VAELIAQQALNGQGVALGTLPFADEDLQSGKLTRSRQTDSRVSERLAACQYGGFLRLKSVNR
jgi:hypothetical protein